MNAPVVRRLLILSIALFSLSGCRDKKDIALIQQLETERDQAEEENTKTVNELHTQLEAQEEAARTALAEATQQVQKLTAERDAITQQMAAFKSDVARAEAARIAKLPKDPSTPGHPEFNPAKESKYTNAMATITGDKSVGTGFVATSGGKLYLYTTASALAGNTRFSISNAAGTKFTKFGNLEVAEKTPFVRLELLETDAVPSLKLADDDTRVGADTKVTCIGTEGSSGSLVSSQGPAMGQTDDTISVDASILQGKCGGPLLETATAKVIAIVVNPAADANELWVEPPVAGQAADQTPLRACRLNRRALWKEIPITTFLADAKKLADYNRLTRIAQALSMLTSTADFGLTTTLSGSHTVQSVLTEAKDFSVAAEVLTLHEDIASKRVRLGEADLKKRFANIFASAASALKRGEADFVPAKFNPFHRPFADTAIKWRKEATKRFQTASGGAEH